jgi:hypothetical protein
MITQLIAAAAVASVLAANLEGRTDATIVFGLITIAVFMRLMRCDRYVVDLLSGPTLPPPPMKADAQAETVAERVDEPSQTRRIGPSQRRDDKKKGAA